MYTADIVENGDKKTNCICKLVDEFHNMDKLIY